MSSFIYSVATWLHCITHINMWVFLVFYHCFYLEKMWPGKNVKVYD